MLPRNALPQIPNNKVEEFCEFINGQDIDIVRGKVDTDKLKPIQSEVNMDKVKNMLSDTAALDKPMIISKDGGILDGHHRWIANKMNENDKVNVIKCNCSMRDLIELGHEFDGSFVKSIKEMTEYGEEQFDDTSAPSTELMVRKMLNYK
jgi:hypothetical protein